MSALPARLSRRDVACAASGGGARLVAPAMLLVVAVTGTALAAVIATSLGLLPLVGQPRLSTTGFTSLSGDLRLAAEESLLTGELAPGWVRFALRSIPRS